MPRRQTRVSKRSKQSVPVWEMVTPRSSPLKIVEHHYQRSLYHLSQAKGKIAKAYWLGRRDLCELLIRKMK